jgi:hypothetical protein
VELGVHAAEVVGPADVGALHLRPAHRERIPVRLDSAEARGADLCFFQQLEVDLNAEDLLHAADVRPAGFLERIEERARAFDTGRRVDHLVAVHPAAAALDLVLRPERQLPQRTGDLA